MRYSLLALAVAAGITASPAFAGAVNLVQNGDFSTLNSGGLGQQGWSDGEKTYGAAGWTNGKNGGNLGYNFVMSVADVGSDGVSGNVALWDAANWIKDPASAVPVADQKANTWNGKTLSRSGNFVALDGAYETAAISQSISGLTVGGTYTLTFDYGFAQQAKLSANEFNGDTIQKLTVQIGGVSVAVPDSAGYPLDGHQFSGWSAFTETFKATAASEDLSFLAWGNKPVPPFALVSDVSLEVAAPGVAVPEPATWALTLAGFAGLGFAGFRGARRKQAALA